MRNFNNYSFAFLSYLKEKEKLDNKKNAFVACSNANKSSVSYILHKIENVLLICEWTAYKIDPIRTRWRVFFY